MKKYELLYILPGELTDAELKGLRERVDGLLKGSGAAVSLNDYAGKVKLAYPIGVHRYGHYILVRFSAEPAAIAKLEADLRLDNDVVRHMIVSADEVTIAAVTLMTRPEEERAAPVESAAPVQAAPVVAAAPLSMEDIDKKIDELLTEEVK